MYIPEEKFSLWADFIERDYLDNGFKALIKEGIINGATSNPSIFKSAILTSPAYQRQIEELSGLDAKAKYEALAIYDIQKAADILRPLYDKGDDGYVSIEVDPMLCDDTAATVDEGRRLYKMIDRPNVMIKVPATEAGYGAMRALVSDGIAVNATLVFSKEQALAAADAFAEGQKEGASVDTVISVFVSRIDRALDTELAANGITPALAGIYNAAAPATPCTRDGLMWGLRSMTDRPVTFFWPSWALLEESGFNTPMMRSGERRVEFLNAASIEAGWLSKPCTSTRS